jgi:hypothetical protein
MPRSRPASVALPVRGAATTTASTLRTMKKVTPIAAG